MNKTTITEILAANNLSPQKAKGQNFLMDEDISRAIVAMLSPAYDSVIEIGPGLGALTKYLVDKTKDLTAIELDRGYVKYLQETYPNVKVIEKDFLKYIVPRETIGVISNIPYYITTKIIEKVILETEKLEVFVFMTQKDLHSRFFAKPKTKEYGPLAILLDLTGKLEQKMIVTADKFYPSPNVDSAVFRFEKKKVTFDIRDFYQFLKFAFLNRRKMMYKNLKIKYDNEALDKVFKEHSLSADIRVEALSPATLLAIYQSLHGK